MESMRCEGSVQDAVQPRRRVHRRCVQSVQPGRAEDRTVRTVSAVGGSCGRATAPPDPHSASRTPRRPSPTTPDLCGAPGTRQRRHLADRSRVCLWLSVVMTCVVTCCATATEYPPTFSQEPQSAIVKEASKVVLQCRVGGGATVQWLFNGSNVTSAGLMDISIHDGYLVIPAFRKSQTGSTPGHSGIYQCVATNRVGAVISREAKIESAYLGEFYEGFRDRFINVTEGNVAFIPCAPPVGKPQPITSYELNGTEIDLNNDLYQILPSGSLQIENVHRRQDGIYRCIATNPISKERRRAPNVVHLKTVLPVTNQAPEFSWVPPTDVTATRGDNVTLECVVEGAPVPVVTWSKYGGKLPADRHRQSLGNLHLYQVGKLDEGTYICSANNGVGKRQVITQVDVQEPPLIQHAPASQTVTEGSRVTFQCQGRGQPNIQTKWYHNGREPTSSVIVTDEALTIPTVVLQDAGVYQCIMGGSLGSVSAAALLTVTKEAMQGIAPDLEHAHPFITRLPRNTTVREGGATVLSCPTNQRHIEYSENFLWFKDSQPIENIVGRGRQQGAAEGVSSEFHFLPSGSLQLLNARPQDSGEYMCVIWVESNSDSASAFLTVTSRDRRPNGTSSQSAPSKIPPTGGDTSDNTDILQIADEEPNNGCQGNRGGRRNRKKNRKNGRTNTQETAVEDCIEPTATESAISEMVPPSKPRVSKLSDTSVMLEWSVRDNAGLPIIFFKVQYKEVVRDKQRRQWRTIEDDISPHIWRFEVKELEPGSTYRFRILGVYSNNDNLHGPNSKRFTMDMDTKPQPPTTGPFIVQARESKSAIRLKWQYLPKKWIPLDGFYIYYQKYGSKDPERKKTVIGSHTREAELSNLDPSTRYSIRMKGFNVAGESEFSNTVVSDGDYQGALHTDWPNISPDSRSPRTTTTALAAGGNDNLATSLSTENSNKLLYIILGCVLGVLVLFLLLFMGVCAWKQQQRARLLAAVEGRNKFHDPARTIHAQDSIRKKQINGHGFLLNGINGGMNGHHGNHTLDNGHMPLYTYPRMHITSNPTQGPQHHSNNHLATDNIDELRASLQEILQQPPPPPPLSDDNRGGSDSEPDHEQYEPRMSSFGMDLPSPHPTDLHLYDNTPVHHYDNTPVHHYDNTPATQGLPDNHNSCQNSLRSNTSQSLRHTPYRFHDPHLTDHIPRSHERLPSSYRKGDSLGRGPDPGRSPEPTEREHLLAQQPGGAAYKHRRRKSVTSEEDNCLVQAPSLDIPENSPWSGCYDDSEYAAAPGYDEVAMELPDNEEEDHSGYGNQTPPPSYESQPIQDDYSSYHPGALHIHEYSDEESLPEAPPSPRGLPRIPRSHDYPATDVDD